MITGKGDDLWTRRTQATGSVISSSMGSVSVDSHPVEPLMPTWSTTALTNLAPSRYCRIFASIPSSRRTVRSKLLAPARRRWNFSRCRDAGHDLGAHTVHDDVGMTLQQ